MKQQYPPKVGERFGRFILLRHLGQGGMGNVYKARVEGANGFVRHVAIKLILREHADDPRFVEMFTDEAKIASLLSHRNIVQVYELGRQDGELFIEMEFVRGWDCRQLLHLSCQRGGPPPPLVAAYIVHEVARGLQYAHEYIDEYDQPRSIVHCDISPQNIVIDRYGQVKLVDFGIAMALTVKNRASSALLQGKLGYMAPELWTDRVYTPQTDIFATGVVLYELLTGKCPNESTTCDKIIHRGNREQDGFSDIMRLDIPSELAAITMKALAREPSERYQHASQLANDLGAVLQSRRFSVEQVEAWLKSICPGGQDEQRAIGSTNDGPRPDPRIADLDPHRTRSVQIKGNSLSVTAEVSGRPHAAASIDGSQSSGAADHRPRDVHILEPGSRQSGVLSRAAASHRLYVGVVTAVALMLLRSSAFHEATLAL
jgi:serine/threonine protein kinase